MMQAHEVVSRYKRLKLIGEGFGRHPGGRHSSQGEEVGSGCDREVIW